MLNELEKLEALLNVSQPSERASLIDRVEAANWHRQVKGALI
jgi:hypothetical protein